MDSQPDPKLSKKLRLAAIQNQVGALDALLRDSHTRLKEVQQLIEHQTYQRDELMKTASSLKEEIEAEPVSVQPCPTIEVNGETADEPPAKVEGSAGEASSHPDAKPIPRRISWPANVVSETPLPDTPYSPPPTAALSPPPPRNRLFAGHTPVLPIALSPQASTDTTPMTVPSKPIAAVVTDEAAGTVHIRPKEADDDTHSEQPLTAQDEGFLDVIREKLEAVKVEEEQKGKHSRSDSLSPIPGEVIECNEQLDGVCLKSMRVVNFGAPLLALPQSDRRS